MYIQLTTVSLGQWVGATTKWGAEASLGATYGGGRTAAPAYPDREAEEVLGGVLN